MALTSIVGSFIFPDTNYVPANNPNSLILDATRDKIAMPYVCTKTGNISKVRFMTSSVTTSDTLKVSFQDRDLATGYPDGIVDEYRTLSVTTGQTWYQTGIMSSDGTDNGTKRAVTKGDRFWIVFEFNSRVAGNMIIYMTNTPTGDTNEAYCSLSTSSVWSKITGCACVEIEYDDGSTVFSPFAIPSINNAATIASNTNPDEIALKFKFPVQVEVTGAYVFIDLDANCDIVLYDKDGTTALETVSLDSDQRNGTSVSGTQIEFVSSRTLEANSYYYLSIKPTTTTTIEYKTYDFYNASSLDMACGGQNFHLAQRTDAGSWTPTTNKRPKIFLRISKITANFPIAYSG